MPKKESLVYTDGDGYQRFKDSNKYVHHWQANKKYPGVDFKGMEIHHLDGDKTNNKQDNLILLTKQDHYLLHEQEKKVNAKYHKVNEWAVTFVWALILFIIQTLIGRPFQEALGVTVIFLILMFLWNQIKKLITWFKNRKSIQKNF